MREKEEFDEGICNRDSIDWDADITVSDRQRETLKRNMAGCHQRQLIWRRCCVNLMDPMWYPAEDEEAEKERARRQLV